MPTLTDEQNAAIFSTDRHVLVSAGAGSGKTFVLVERYINVLRTDPEAGVSDIIAVTFTKKAAEEMRSRLKARLKELIETCDITKTQERERWAKCFAELESARIGTIHSLCESILKGFPAEAGIDPAFEIIDELERAELLAQSIDEALHMIIEQPLAQSELLLDYPIESLRNWLSNFLKSPLKYSEARSRFSECSIESLREFARSLIKQEISLTLKSLVEDPQFQSECSYLLDNEAQNSQSKLAILRDEMIAHLAIINDLAKSAVERFNAIKELAHMESARSAGGPKAAELRACMRIIRNLARPLASRHKSELNASDEKAFEILQAFIKLADDALSRYQLLKERHQKLDFDDLIQLCQKLLSGASEKSSLDRLQARKAAAAFAQKQLSRNLKAILVDEFQDTNWTQARLLTALASTASRLFLIGDDKQSIYKFQGADVATFNACKAYISSLQEQNTQEQKDLHRSIAASYELPALKGEGKELTLSQSFRSHPQIVSFVNYLFSIMFESKDEQKETNFKSRFQALQPARLADQDQEQEQKARVEIIYIADPQEENEADSTERRSKIDKLEAMELAFWIQEKVDSKTEIFDKSINSNRPINYADFAVLLQANSDFAGIESALAQAGIPYVSIAGSGFLERQEVYDMQNLLKFLSCPQDGHALLGILRSPIFGFSDDRIHELKAGKSLSLWRCLSQEAAEKQDEHLLRTRRILQTLIQESGSLTISDLLRKAIQLTAYDITLLSTEQGKQKSRNVWKFLAFASQHKHMSISEFVSSLDSMRELGVKNLTDAPLSADNAVKIMTIHKSKGLEFAAVALPRLARGTNQRADKMLFGKDFGIAFDCTKEKEEEKPAFFTAANFLSRRMDEEEKKRLLYVALTRARDYLALFINSRCKRNTNFGKWLISSLNLPEADGSEIEEELVKCGGSKHPCSFQLKQARARLLPPEKSSSEESLYNENSAEHSDLSGYSLDLLDFRDPFYPSLTYKTVPWQGLLRACPKESSVHATIAGNYFHLLMAKFAESLELPSPDEREALLADHEVSVHDQEQQKELLQSSENMMIALKNSKLYSLMKSARRHFVEEAFLIIEQSKVSEYRPDLIIEDENGNWHVVDYKTDHFELKLLEKQLKNHQEQLSKYVEGLEKVLGLKTKPWVYFASHGRLEPVNIAAPLQLSLFGGAQ